METELWTRHCCMAKGEAGGCGQCMCGNTEVSSALQNLGKTQDKVALEVVLKITVHFD